MNKTQEVTLQALDKEIDLLEKQKREVLYEIAVSQTYGAENVRVAINGEMPQEAEDKSGAWCSTEIWVSSDANQDLQS